jgi:hypothetical protein
MWQLSAGTLICLNMYAAGRGEAGRGARSPFPSLISLCSPSQGFFPSPSEKASSFRSFLSIPCPIPSIRKLLFQSGPVLVDPVRLAAAARRVAGYALQRNFVDPPSAVLPPCTASPHPACLAVQHPADLHAAATTAGQISAIALLEPGCFGWRESDIATLFSAAGAPAQAAAGWVWGGGCKWLCCTRQCAGRSAARRTARYFNEIF